jgi:hypothetical protein
VTATKGKKLTTDADGDVEFVSPAGVKMSGPPGLLQFLVGIPENESTWDYFRNQGSPVGSVEAAPTTASEAAATGGGYGAYQFQWGTDQYNQAAAASWSPAQQDQIAAAMATGYYKEFGPLAERTGVNPWEYVAEAWYGPGTVPQNPIAYNSQADVANVLAAEGGHAALPQGGYVFGPYKGGLTDAQLKKELGGAQITTATLDGLNWDPTDLFGLPGTIAGVYAGEAKSAASSLLGSSLFAPLGLLALKVVVTLGGGALIVLGIHETMGGKGSVTQLIQSAPAPSSGGGGAGGAAPAAPEIPPVVPA